MVRKTVVIGLTLLALPTLSGCRITANFYEVDPGKLYRSAQLDEKELKKLFRHVGVKTIINLRGARPKEPWYPIEKRVSQEAGVDLIDIAMRPRRLPHREDLIKLLDVFENARRPILVHCATGADRTGEAVAIYQMEYLGYSREEALQSLVPKYFHFENLAPAKRYFISLWRNSDWARHYYDPCAQEYDFYPRAEECPR